MTETVLKTKRLILRKIEPADTGDIGRILQDENVMYAWEHRFYRRAGRQLDKGKYCAV